MANEIVLGCGALQVVFVRRGDRYGHEISCESAAGAAGRLVSREGAPSDLWPASPPLQSLHLETQSGVQTVLLVGTAGRSHWSMSVVAEVPQNRLHFDVACRFHDAPAWLGSVYDGFEPQIQTWGFDGLELNARSHERDHAEIIPEFDYQQGTVRFAAAQPVASGSQTVRWKYAISAAKSR